MCVQLFTPLTVHFCSIIASCPECHNALRLVYQVIITGAERHDNQVLCNANEYALDLLYLPLFSLSFSISDFSLSFLSPISHHTISSHVRNYSLFASLSLISVDDSGVRMFAMATPSSCAMGCKLMVSV